MGDTRPSIAERYHGRSEYLAHVESTANALVAQRFLIESDVTRVVALAGRHWDAIMNPTPAK